MRHCCGRRERSGDVRFHAEATHQDTVNDSGYLLGSVLGAVPTAVHRGGHLLAGKPGPELLRLDHAAQLRAVHQPHLHHHLRVFAGLWTKLGSRQPSTPLKFSLGLVFMGLAFLLFK
jgi:hypothetical protein